MTLPPAADRRFEDYPVGAVFDIGTFVLSENEIVAFAARYDPQAMHTDRGWAAQGPFGEVIASGWHTIAALMRLIVENFLPESGLASPGVDELRWLLPVQAGRDTARAGDRHRGPPVAVPPGSRPGHQLRRGAEPGRRSRADDAADEFRPLPAGGSGDRVNEGRGAKSLSFLLSFDRHAPNRLLPPADAPIMLAWSPTTNSTV